MFRAYRRAGAMYPSASGSSNPRRRRAPRQFAIVLTEYVCRPWEACFAQRDARGHVRHIYIMRRGEVVGNVGANWPQGNLRNGDNLVRVRFDFLMSGNSKFVVTSG